MDFDQLRQDMADINNMLQVITEYMASVSSGNVTIESTQDTRVALAWITVLVKQIQRRLA